MEMGKGGSDEALAAELLCEGCGRQLNGSP